MSQFYTLLTKVGQAKLANAIAVGEPLTVIQLAVGDGGGSLPTPDATVTQLVNEQRRGPINRVETDEDNPNYVVCEQVLPPDVGGWYIREVGAFDADGDLIAYGNYPETYKPQLSEGSSRTQTVRFVMQVSDTSAVTLKVDPTVVLATRGYVDDAIDAHAKSRNHPYADTVNQGMVKFATLTEARAGEESKAALTPAGGKAQLDDHRGEDSAHKAGQIALDAALSVFGEAADVQAVLAMLGHAATMRYSDAGLDGVAGAANEVASTEQLVALRKRIATGSLSSGSGSITIPYMDGPTQKQLILQLFQRAVSGPGENKGDMETYTISYPVAFPSRCNKFIVFGLNVDGTVEGSEVSMALRTYGAGSAVVAATRVTGSSTGAERMILDCLAIGE